MRPIAFFVIVFSIMVFALYLVVGTGSDVGSGEERIETTAVETSTDDRNTIELPYYDVEQGRLAYLLRGELPPNVFKFTEINHPTNYELRNGQLDIPIYSDPSDDRVFHGIRGITRLVLTFARAEYREVKKSRTRTEGVVHLTGGGEGRGDDGTRISFEELDVHIRKPASYVYELRSNKPISIRNDLIEMRSPSGLEAIVKSDTNLETITFLPPVVTIIDAAAARLLAPEAGGLVGEIGKLATEGVTPAGDENGSVGTEDPAQEMLPSRLAITCEGPLVLDRTETPTRIEFRDSVTIFPIDDPDEDDAAAADAVARDSAPDVVPEPGDTWFQCETFALLVREEKKRAPELIGAIARWPGQRVLGRYEGLLVEGEELRWDLGPRGEDGKPLDSKTGTLVLSGRPQFLGEEVEIEADTARFRLDRRLVSLSGSVVGRCQFVRERRESKPPETEREGRGAREGPTRRDPDPEKDAGAEGADLAQDWEFVADEVDVVIAKRRASSRDRAGKREDALERIESFVARSHVPGGLQATTAATSGSTITGTELAYTAATRRAVMRGTPERAPRFDHGDSHGVAERLALAFADNQQSLELSGDVDLTLAGAEMRALRRASRGKDRPREGGATDSDDSAPPGEREPAAERSTESESEEPGEPSARLLEGLHVRADLVEVLFDEDRAIQSARAVSTGDHDVSLRPLGDSGAYSIEGPHLFWDNTTQVARLESTGPDRAPSLGFRGGRVSARTIRFDQSTWTATLEKRVEILSGALEIPDLVGQGSTRAPVIVRCDRARVDFNEWFDRKGPDSVCAPELRSIRGIEAWTDGGPDRRLEIDAAAYRARSRRATWDARTQTLRLHGEGLQELELQRGESPRTLAAEEIVYHRQRGVIELSRGVTGEFLLEERLSGAGSSPGSPARAGRRSDDEEGAGVMWRYSTDRVTIRVTERPDCGGLELANIAAFDKVFLECPERGLKLHGDDLEYDAARQEVRIFSRDGRYQTLTQEVRGPDGGEQRTNKIDSREIRLWHFREPGPTGASRDAIVVRFFEDVTAAFFPDDKLEVPIPTSSDERDEWKLRADYLGVRIAPGAPRQRTVESAYAEGEVIFTSGDMKAMAREAIYEESEQRLILRGSDATKVQLSHGDRTFADEMITLSKRGSRFRIQTQGRQDRAEHESVDRLRRPPER